MRSSKSRLSESSTSTSQPLVIALVLGMVAGNVHSVCKCHEPERAEGDIDDIKSQLKTYNRISRWRGFEYKIPSLVRELGHTHCHTARHILGSENPRSCEQ